MGRFLPSETLLGGFFFFFFKPGQTCSCLVLQNPNCTVLDVDDAVLSGL